MWELFTYRQLENGCDCSLVADYLSCYFSSFEVAPKEDDDESGEEEEEEEEEEVSTLFYATTDAGEEKEKKEGPETAG